jgi:hypothetical protein
MPRCALILYDQNASAQLGCNRRAFAGGLENYATEKLEDFLCPIPERVQSVLATV